MNPYQTNKPIDRLLKFSFWMVHTARQSSCTSPVLAKRRAIISRYAPTPAAVDFKMTLAMAHHLQKSWQVQSEMHTTWTQAEECLQKFHDYLQLTAPGPAHPPSLDTALRSPGSNELLDRAVCLVTPAEQAEEAEEVDLVVLEQDSNIWWASQGDFVQEEHVDKQ
eukprot:gene3254-3532_t